LAIYVNAGNTDYNDKYYKLDNDLDMSEKVWIPIGSHGSISFKGFFDGNNKIITGLKFKNYGTSGNMGLFGYLQGGTIKNTGVSVIESNHSRFPQGAIVGCNDGGIVSNCYSTGFIMNDGSYGSIAGGIVGHNKGGTVSNCYSTAMVRSSGYFAYTGGIVGDNEYGTVSNCYSTGLVVSSVEFATPGNDPETPYTGGIAGQNWGGNVINCVALNPRLSCQSGNPIKYFGRIVGRQGPGTLTNNTAFNNMINASGGTTWNNVGAYQIDGKWLDNTKWQTARIVW
jgi:hypothetical protein